MKDFRDDEILKTWVPPRFGRGEVDRLFPGIVSKQTLQNLASTGEGPPSVRIRGRVVYERGSFLAWLDNQRREKN